MVCKLYLNEAVIKQTNKQKRTCTQHSPLTIAVNILWPEGMQQVSNTPYTRVF